MQGRRGNSNPSIDGFKPESLKKIIPNDRFPCFSCFDHAKEKLECKECQGNGWVSGSHPMVQFAQDFIQKRMGSFVHSQMISSMDIGDSNVRMSLSDDPQRNQRDSLRQTLTKTGTFGQQPPQEEESQLEQYYFCDQCIAKEPIKGKRYHCRQCEDYDLCESCFVCGMHSHHKMQQILPFKRPDNQTLMAKNSEVNLVRKSIKFSGR